MDYFKNVPCVSMWDTELEVRFKYTDTNNYVDGTLNRVNGDLSISTEWGKDAQDPPEWAHWRGHCNRAKPQL
jgi:hypothetical protein